ncbi:hypothetical protein VNI00_016966 [Paramarasmius palmivorus]|uniref:Uncharacterized protein n=1 Tax=Paramarasmius palmivorus TaxID=297713 RepID=A0AAW0BAN7_9AGAR
MSSSNQAPANIEWNVDTICLASSKIQTILPQPTSRLTCTPNFYDSPNKAIKPGPEAKNFYILMERSGGSRYRQGIYRDYQDIKRQLPNENLDGSTAICQGYETFEEARQAWKTKCTQNHTSTSHANHLRAQFNSRILQTAHAAKGQLVITALNDLYGSRNTSSLNTVISSPPTSPRRNRALQWQLYLASDVGVYGFRDLKQAYNALNIAGEDTAMLFFALDRDTVIQAWADHQDSSDEFDVAGALADLSV